MRAASEELEPLWRAEGLEPRPYGGAYDHLYLDISPPRLQLPGGEHVGARQALRPVPFDDAADRVLPPHVLDGSEHPLVYLTFGTVFNDNEAFRGRAGRNPRASQAGGDRRAQRRSHSIRSPPLPCRPRALHPPDADPASLCRRGFPRRIGDGPRRPGVRDLPAVPSPGRRPVHQRGGRGSFWSRPCDPSRPGGPCSGR